MTSDEVKALAAVLTPLMREMVRDAVSPLYERQAATEAALDALKRDVPALSRAAIDERIAALPTPKDGAPGVDGASVTPDDVAPLVARSVAEYLAAHPAPAGERGEPGADGASVTLDDVAPLVARSVAEYLDAHPAQPGRDGERGAPGVDGASVTLDDVAPLVARSVAEYLDAHPAQPGRDGERGAPGVDGASVTLDDVAPLVARSVAEYLEAHPAPAGRDGKDGAPGMLGRVTAWEDGVTYAGDVRTHGGSLWQALRDTGHAPGHADWHCLAERGTDGRDADQIDVVGTYDPAAIDQYRRLNIVALNGATFIARRDAPGECPGDGWQLMSMQGRRGATGERGERGLPGARGEAGPGVLSLSVDGQGMLTLVMADGAEITCDLYDVLVKR